MKVFLLEKNVREVENREEVKIGCTIFSQKKSRLINQYNTYAEAKNALMRKPAMQAKYKSKEAKSIWKVTEYVLEECLVDPWGEYLEVINIILQDGSVEKFIVGDEEGVEVQIM